MREREFRELLDKFFDGSITVEEKQLLNTFKEHQISENSGPHFEDRADKEYLKESSWEGIKTRTDLDKAKNRAWKIPAAAAALFIGLLTVGYLYLNDTATVVPQVTPTDAITLELEDGSLKVLEEGGSMEVTDKKGSVLGRQQGNQLVYSETGAVEELEFNTLKVPFGRTFELQLSDGTKVFLNAGSSLKYPVKFPKDRNRFVSISGEAYLNVAKDSERPFIVSADGLNVRVLGTQFNISAYPEDNTADVVLVEGSVSLSAESEEVDSENKVLLEPGFKGSFHKNNEEIIKDPVITDWYTSWMKGELIFRNMTFENIVKRLERHYNVTILNKNKDLSDKMFNANFGQQSIGNVLKELNANYDIEYSISGDKITIE